jgi:hypothetical protein
MMNKQSIAYSWLLLLTAVLAAGCSLIDNPEANPATAPDPASGTEEADKGTIIVNVATEPANEAGSFTFTGVPTGTLTTESPLVVADLPPGTYTTTQIDPAPDFDVTAVTCDDGDSDTTSSGDPQTRTAVVNLDPGETVTCRFTNTQRATAVVVVQSEPDGVAGNFLFTGVPSGTIPVDGTLVTANLRPGTYTTTEADPAPQFDLTAVSCDDGGSATVSGGDPATRSAIFQLDPGETVSCTFVNTRRGTLIVSPAVSSDGSEALFTYTGVPSGTVATGQELVATDLSPGTYTSTEVDPAPEFELTEVLCDDGGSGLASSGDAATRSAIFNVDAGETVRCVFTHERLAEPGEGAGAGSGGSSGGGGEESGAQTGDGINPFDDPDTYLSDFPLPEQLPAEAGAGTVPKAGPWTVTNLAGQMDCGLTALAIPAAAPEQGTIEVQDGGRTLVGTSLQEDQTAPVVMTADPEVAGRYTGAFEGAEQGVPVTINYVWQVVTDEYVVGYLTASLTAEGVTCSVYRPYELSYTG